MLKAKNRNKKQNKNLMPLKCQYSCIYCNNNKKNTTSRIHTKFYELTTRPKVRQTDGQTDCQIFHIDIAEIEYSS